MQSHAVLDHKYDDAGASPSEISPAATASEALAWPSIVVPVKPRHAALCQQPARLRARCDLRADGPILIGIDGPKPIQFAQKFT